MSKKSSPLPIKKGVSPNSLWLKEGRWGSMLDFFLSQFPHLDTQSCLSRFESGEVMTDDGHRLNSYDPYCPGKHIFFYRELSQEIKVPFEEEIIYQDENILVVDKPHFLPVAPSGSYLHETLIVRLRNRLNIDSLELCHRLDRETAGVVLLTKEPKYRGVYQSLFAERKITKTYQAIAKKIELKLPLKRRSQLVKGQPYFRMKEQKGEANSETYINLLKVKKEFALYQLVPVTGKKHQLRVHMASIGTPILNDPLYPRVNMKASDDFSNPLQLLAKSLEFVDPLTGKKCFFESGKELVVP